MAKAWHVLFALGIAGAASAAPAQQGASPALDAGEYDEAVRTLLCDCGCHPQSVHDCACGRAAEMRSEIAAEVGSGKTAEQIIEARGEAARIVPTTRGFNLVAWLGPAAGFLIAAGVMIGMLRRWRRTSKEAGGEAGGEAGAGEAGPYAPLATDDAYLARIRHELEEAP